MGPNNVVNLPFVNRFISATTNWSLADIVYYTNCQSLSLTCACPSLLLPAPRSPRARRTVFGLLWSLVIAKFRTGYKKALIFALCLRMFGVGLMLHARNGRGNVGELVITQIIQGAGGGIAAIATGVSSQGSVAHQGALLRFPSWISWI